MTESSPKRPLDELMQEILSRDEGEKRTIKVVLNALPMSETLGEQAQSEEERRDESRKRIKAWIEEHKKDLSGPKLALSACCYMDLGGVEKFLASAVGAQIADWTGSRPSNITSTLDALKQRGQVEAEGAEKSHKTYWVTADGKSDFQRMMRSKDETDKST